MAVLQKTVIGAYGARITVTLIIFITISFNVCAQDTTHEDCMSACACENINLDAPIGVPIDHMHSKGSWMVSYRYMSMRMQDNRDNSVPVTDDQVYIRYMMSPARMQMDMHMLMGMYSISDRFTVMLMLNYLNSRMDMHMMPTEGMDMPGMRELGNASGMTMKTSSLADTRLYGMYRLYQGKGQLVILAAGLSLPTGKTDLQSASFSGLSMERASYNMQTGSGTIDILPSAAYTGKAGNFGWGAEAMAIIRPYDNHYGYRLGNEADVTGWLSYRWANWISNSIRLESISRGTMYRYDKEIYQYKEPGADPANYGGEQLVAYAGMNFYIKHGLLKDNKLGIEYGIPFYQQLNGLQMNLHYVISAGWQYSF